MRAETDARLRPGIPLAVFDLGLSVEVRGPIIAIANRKRSFAVSYVMAPDASQLVLNAEWWCKRAEAPAALARLRSCAWRLANDTAAKLGWFDRLPR